MRTSVSLQYAKALFDVANDASSVDEYLDYLKTVCKLFVDDENTNKVLNHPAVSNEERKSIIENTLKEYLPTTFINYLKVLVDNQRFNELKDILDSYEGLVDDYHQQCNAYVYAKYELSDEEKSKLVVTLEKKLNKKVNLVFKNDPSLVGGIKIVAGGKVMDATIKSEMLDLKNELKKGW